MAIRHATLTTELDPGDLIAAAQWDEAHEITGEIPGFTIYGPDIYLVPPMSADTNAAQSTAANVRYVAPLFISRGLTATRIGCWVNTGAAGNARLGVWKSGPDGLPGDLLLDGGAVSTAVAGLQELTVNQYIAPGLYYLGLNMSAAISMMCYGVTDLFPALQFSSTHTRVTGLSRSKTYGPLDSETLGTSWTRTTIMPVVHLRAA